MKNYIKEKMPPAAMEDTLKLLSDSRAKLNGYTVGLSDKEKTGIRSMAQGREGYARLISQISITHVNSLAREHDPGMLDDALQYDAQLEKLRQMVMAVEEMITETQLANSIDIMRMVDSFAESLQISRRGNEGLDNALREVDDWNKRFGARNTVPTPPEEL